jgi:hypothetical protein
MLAMRSSLFSAKINKDNKYKNDDVYTKSVRHVHFESCIHAHKFGAKIFNRDKYKNDDVYTTSVRHADFESYIHAYKFA